MTIRKAQRAGKTVLVIDIPFRTPDGRQCRYRRDAQVQTKTAAEAEHKRLIAELVTTGRIETRPSPLVKVKERAPEEPAPTSPLVKDVGQDFLDSLKLKKPSTKHSYTDIFDRVLRPRWGETPVGDIDFTAVSLLDQELTEKKKSPSTRRNAHIVLRSFLRFCVDRGHIEERPKLPKLPKVGRTVLSIPSASEVDRIIQHATKRARVAFSLMVWAGLRPAEIRALRWSDVDLAKGQLIVRHAISRQVQHTPKSGHQRSIPIAGQLKAILEAAEKKPGGLVAPSKRGLPWGDWGLHTAFQRAAKAAKVSGKFRVYDLRHYFVTSCFRARVPAPAVQRLAGHAELGTTQRYAHMVESDLENAIEALGNYTETARKKAS